MIEPYAKDCVRLPQPLECRAFFPGGEGLWSPGHPAARIRVLILGSDFNNEKNYDAELQKPPARRLQASRTWARLDRLLSLAAVDPLECFFTNAWPCLRQGSYPNCGNPPGAKDPAFTARCLAFFQFTLQQLQPRYVVPLGGRPTQFLSLLDPALMQPWRKPQWRSIDAQDHVTLRIAQRPVTIVPVTHPSHPNQHHRLVHTTLAAEALHLKRIIGR